MADVHPTERALADAAVGLLETGTFRELTVARVTAAAGTSHGTFYLYFKNREDLLLRLVERVGTALSAEVDRLEGDGDPRESVRIGLRSLIGVCRAHAPVLRAFQEAATYSPRFTKLFDAIRRQFRDRLRAIFAQRGVVGLDLDVAAGAMVAMIEGFALDWVIRGERSGTADDETATETLETMWWRALYADAR